MWHAPVPTPPKPLILTSDLSKPTGGLKKKKTSKATTSAEAKDETRSSKPRSGAVESSQVENDSNSNTTTSKKRREPETVVDPSIALSSLSKKRRGEEDSSKVDRIDEDLAKFIDSRGAGQSEPWFQYSLLFGCGWTNEISSILLLDVV